MIERIDPWLEAVIVRAILEYDWPKNAPDKNEIDAYAAFKKTVINFCEYPVSDRGLKNYSDGLPYDDQFDSIGQARRMYEHHIEALKRWISA